MSSTAQHLLLLLVLQFHGTSGPGPSLALVPRQGPDRPLKHAILPLAFAHRQRVYAQIKLPPTPLRVSPITDALRLASSSCAGKEGEAVLDGTDPPDAVMRLRC